MKTSYVAIASGLVLASLMAGPAFAERGEKSYYSPPTFSDLDINRDGVLDRGEVQGRTPIYGEWGQYDYNKDNVLERSEFSAFEPRSAMGSRGDHDDRGSGISR